MLSTGSLRALDKIDTDEVWIITRSNKFGKLPELTNSKGNPIKFEYHSEYAPSLNLLTSFHAYEKVNGATKEAFDKFYVPKFKEELAQMDLKPLLEASEEKDICLACFCLDESTCHRKFVKEKIMELNRMQEELERRQNSKTAIIIAGTRTFSNEDYLNAVLDKLLANPNIDNPTIFSGGCQGADLMAEDYCYRNNILFERFDADWKAEGRSAGPIRNVRMHTAANDAFRFDKTLCVCFWDGKSRGTSHNFKLAEENNEALIICHYDPNTNRPGNIKIKRFDEKARQMDNNIEFEH